MKPQQNPIIDYATFEAKIEKYDHVCRKLEISFNKADSRCWTAIINPNKENIYVTCHANKWEYGDRLFDILASGKIVLDVDPEDVYQTIDLIINKTTSVVVADKQ